MIVAAIALAADMLRANASGLNAQLEGVPREPDQAAPPPVTILDENTCDWLSLGPIARDQLLDAAKDGQPTVLIRQVRVEAGLRVQLLAEYFKTDPTVVPIEILYLWRHVEGSDVQMSPAEMKIAARHTMRTIARVFAQQFDSHMKVFQRAGVELSLLDDGFLLIPEPELATDVVCDAGVLPLRALDRWALGVGD